MLNKKYPGNTVTMAGVISAKYGDEALAKMIEPAMHVPSQQRLAANLVLQQRNNWEAAVKSVDDVFTLLRLDKAGTTFQNFADKQVVQLRVRCEHEGTNSMMVSALTARFGDDGLAKVLLAAKPYTTRKMK